MILATIRRNGPLVCLVTAFAITGKGLRGQDAASTLDRLERHADVIAQARVVGSSDDGTTVRVTLRVQTTIKGALAGSIELREPAGRACGRALHGVLSGAGYLVFLSTNTGEPRLLVASSRSFVRLDPELLAHVRSLVTAGTDTERVALLIKALDSRSERVARDAATALPVSAVLDHATPAGRQRIVSTLRRQLGRDDYAALGLIRAAVRLRLREAVPVLLPHYLSGSSTPLQTTMRQTIVALDSPFAITRITTAMPVDLAAQRRAITLLEHCSSPPAERCLEALAGSESRRIKVLATESLARRRRATDSPQPRFRSIRPHGGGDLRHE